MPKSITPKYWGLAAAGGVRYSKPQVDPPSQGDITPALVVEYVDTAGVRQTTPVVDGVTTITGRAPFIVSFDATETRSVETPDAPSAFRELGYRLNYGETTGLTWRFPEGTAYPKDEDVGPPVFEHCYRTPGTYTARLRCRTPSGTEATISFTVNVTAHPTTIHIPQSQGGWPSWVNDTRYTLDAGADYRGFGALETFNGAHNILLEKIGVGDNPMIGRYAPENRGAISTEPYVYRSKHIRAIGVDIGIFAGSTLGTDYSGILDSVIRAYSEGYVGWDVRTPGNARTNARFARGLYWEDCEFINAPGPVQDTPSSFTVYAVCRAWMARGCWVRMPWITTTSTSLLVRQWGTKNRWRNCKFTIEADNSEGRIGTYTSLLSINGATEPGSLWRDDDIEGPVDLPQYSPANDRYGYRGEHNFQHRCQFGDSNWNTAPTLPNGNNSIGGNPTADSGIYPYLNGWEDCIWATSGGTFALSMQHLAVSGLYPFIRNCRNQSAFTPTEVRTISPAPAPADTYNDPTTALLENENSRPVPSAF